MWKRMEREKRRRKEAYIAALEGEASRVEVAEDGDRLGDGDDGEGLDEGGQELGVLAGDGHAA